jgi:hypothetical protein
MPKPTEKAVSDEIERKIDSLGKMRGAPCYSMIVETQINSDLVDTVYDELRKLFGSGNEQLDVIIDNSGGDIDAAYNIAQLFRSYGSQQLNFIVPRWAKSAATLVACAGDAISMTPVAELGPMDPQITATNSIEGRMERFSPLDIESALSLIRQEYAEGHEKLAQGLLQRMQFPLTLGSFKKSLDVSQQYLAKLLSSRMLQADATKAADVAKRLTEGYAHHGFCINAKEAETIGLVLQQLPEDQLELVWDIHKLHRQRRELERERKRKEVQKKLKGLPPELTKAASNGALEPAKT